MSPPEECVRYKALLVVLVLTLFGAGPIGPIRAATNETDQGVAVVRATYDDLLALFYRPLTPRDLLQAGWAALAHPPAGVKGLPAPGQLGNLPDDQQAAMAAFEARFRPYAASVKLHHGPLLAAYVAADGMAESLHEQHTHFIPGIPGAPEDIGGAGQEPGLGVRLTSHAPWIVSEVAPESAAAQNGVAVGDVLVAVDGNALDGASQTDVEEAIHGEPGTKTKVTLDRDGSQRSLTLTNSAYTFPLLSSRMLDGGVAYVRLEEFGSSARILGNGLRLLTDFDRRLDEFDARGATALILDLRDNPGGSITTEQALTGRFLPPDTPTMVAFDERGHQLTGIVDGHPRARQLPLVVLVNDGSASSSEATASTLREANRAILVGQKTHGALATSIIYPLPGGSALQVALAEMVSTRSGSRIDEAGVPVDVDVPDDRTAADFRAGRDPQLQAALQAVAKAPVPSEASLTPAATTAARLHAALNGYSPDPHALDLDAGRVSLVRGDANDYVYPNQVIAEGARDPLALQQAIRDRGWLGRHVQVYDVRDQEALGLELSVDVYATTGGAQAALEANDVPDLEQQVDSPVNLGDATVAYRGVWMELGSTTIAWRRDNAVVTVSYFATPGHERTDLPVAFAQLVNQQFDRYPLRTDTLQQTAPTAPTTTAQATTVSEPEPTSQPAAASATSPSRESSDQFPTGMLILGLAMVGLAVAAFVVQRGARGRTT